MAMLVTFLCVYIRACITHLHLTDITQTQTHMDTCTYIPTYLAGYFTHPIAVESNYVYFILFYFLKKKTKKRKNIRSNDDDE